MIEPTGHEIFFDRDEMIVSKTNLKGHITYANETFQRVSGFTEAELHGKPHNLIRHPAMPRCVFKLLWETLQADSEIFAYVVNLAKNGDHYWVLAHVTPSYWPGGEVMGYHSARRVPNPNTVQTAIVPLYRDLLRIEASHANPKEGMRASFQALVDILDGKKIRYDEFVADLSRAA